MPVNAVMSSCEMDCVTALCYALVTAVFEPAYIDDLQPCSKFKQDSLAMHVFCTANNEKADWYLPHWQARVVHKSLRTRNCVM